MPELFREWSLRASWIAMSFVPVLVASAHASTITGLMVKPTQAQAGTSITATATGSGLCGAVNIDWGDGAAITYATSTLPVSQSHVYQSAGTFTVRAQGMGNCDGQATASVTITAPPPPPAPEPRLTAIELSPPAGAPRAPVTITLQGTGACRVAVDFGDGNSQELNGALPLSVRHAYGVARNYTIVATPMTPCRARQTASLTVGDQPKVARVAGIEVTPREGGSGVRAIRVHGEGSCAYTLDFGDGNSEGRNAVMPEVVQHNYPADGRYTIVATAAPPCVGVVKGTIVVGGEQGGRVSRVDLRPPAGTPDQAFAVTVAGSGTCQFTVDFGDGKSRKMTESLPHRFTYRFADPGEYEIFVWTEPPCTGDASGSVRVRRRQAE
jgi:PKD repeat protein